MAEAPVDSHFIAALRSLGFASPMPPNLEVSRRDVMQKVLGRKLVLKLVETHVIRIPVVYLSSTSTGMRNTVPIGPQGKIISSHKSSSAREELRWRVSKEGNCLPSSAWDGRIAYKSFANAVKGRVAE